MLTQLFSFLGIKKVVLIIDDEIQALLDLWIISNGPTHSHLMDFQFTCMYMGMQNGSKFDSGIVDSHLLWHLKVFLYVCIGKPCIHNVMFSTHALREWAWPRAHTYMMTFCLISSNLQCSVHVPSCIVWLDYVCSYTVALSIGTIPSFAVLHTEKLAAELTLVESRNAILGDTMYIIIPGLSWCTQ